MVPFQAEQFYISEPASGAGSQCEQASWASDCLITHAYSPRHHKVFCGMSQSPHARSACKAYLYVQFD